MSTELLITYLQDHHAGASAGIDLFRRVADSHSRPAVAAEVSRLADEIAEDKELLEELMAQVGAKPSVAKDLPARVGEKVSQLKTNNRLVERSPLSDLIELEALTLAVHGKLLGWKMLRQLDDPRLPATALDRLIDRAADQGKRLDALRLDCADVLHGE
ncbi:hypothetical protein GCM10027418_05550 [Mariniluteicoccus endophyticus]